jgi:hypothetical protein
MYVKSGFLDPQKLENMKFDKFLFGNYLTGYSGV